MGQQRQQRNETLRDLLRQEVAGALGSPPEARLRWLVTQFVERPDALQSGLESLRVREGLALLTLRHWGSTEDVGLAPPRPTEITAKELEPLRAELEHRLRSYVAGKRWDWPLSPATVRTPTGRGQLMYRGTPGQAVISSVGFLLTLAGERLGVCAAKDCSA